MLSVDAQSALRRMRAEVLEGHWIKGQGADGQGNYCLAGLVAHQAKGDALVHQEVYTAVDLVVRIRGYGSIPSFNDATRTKQGDIVEVIDQAMRR